MNSLKSALSEDGQIEYLWLFPLELRLLVVYQLLKQLFSVVNTQLGKPNPLPREAFHNVLFSRQPVTAW